MKKVLSLFATALLLTACSNDDAGTQGYQPSGLPIAFNAEQVNFATRAAGEIGDLDALKRKGFGIFACYTGKLKYEFTSVTSDFMYNQEVDWSGTGEAWDYTPLKYWPNEFTDMVSFFAYAPYEGEPSGDKCIAAFQPVNEQGDPWLVYKLAQNLDEQEDLLYGVNESTEKPWFDLNKPGMESVMSPIKFKFFHALSCIGDVVTLKADDLIAKLGDYGTVLLDSIVIDYDYLTSKARLNLNSEAGAPNWKAIVSGDVTAKRTVVLKPESSPAELTNAGWSITEKGLFYIPLKVAAENPVANITVWYSIKDNEGHIYEKGHATSSFNLDMTNDAVGKKQGIALTLTENLDLLHLTYVIDPNAYATEPSYSRETK